MKNFIKKLLRESLLDEGLQKISHQEAINKNLFGPVYHGTTQDNIKQIQDKGFEIFVGGDRTGNIRHGYPEQSYGNTNVPPPIHHLGYGIYFTTVKSIAKKFNQNTIKNLKEYYLDIPRLETINFASPKKMMDWWIKNGYDPDLAKQNRIEATKRLTDNLKSKYDGVYFKGGGLYRHLDGNQIVVFDTNRIYQIDNSLSQGKDIGSKVVLVQDLMRWVRDENGESKQVLVTPKGMTGVIKDKKPAQPMRDYWFGNGNEKPHWTEDSDYVYTIIFKKGGTQHNILDKHIEPIK